MESQSSSSQQIGNVSTGFGGQTFAGYAGRDVIFAGRSEPDSREEIKKCRNALFLTFPEDDRASLISAKGKRVEGTCEWIRENATYKSWLQGDKPLLWIYGGPGKGKTMLSIFLTQELESNRKVIYSFCSSNDEKRNSAAAILRGLLWQITAIFPKLTEQLVQYFDSREKTDTSLASLETLWRMFRAVCSDPELEPIVCLIDGLDECDETSTDWLATRLVEFASATIDDPKLTNVKTILVSRDIFALRRNVEVPRIDLDPDNDEQIGRDIRNFVLARVQELSCLPGYDSGFGETVTREILERADGTFLGAGFAMSELLRKHTCMEVEDALRSLPRGLLEIYDCMLRHIAPGYREDVSKILQWVALAVRPLSLKELAAAIDCKATTRRTPEQNIRDLVSLCSPFLVVLEPKAAAKHRNGSKSKPAYIVSLVHHTAKDYLLGKGRDHTTVQQDFRFESELCNLKIAWDCLACIHANIPLDIDKFFSRPTPLLEYAVRFWPAHARDACELSIRLIEHPSGFFEHKSTSRTQWWFIYVILVNIATSAQAPPLHLVCYLGNIPLAQGLLDQGTIEQEDVNPVNQKDSSGDTALAYAIRGGSEQMVRKLLNHNANIHAANLSGETVLHRAAYWCQEKMVTLLLEQTVDVNARNKYGETALHHAVFRKQRQIVKLLLNHNVDVNAADSNGKTALHKAVECQDDRIVKLLLRYDADVNARNHAGRTALFIAAESSKRATVQLLLNYGAVVDGGAERETDVAVGKGRHELAKLLKGYKSGFGPLLRKRSEEMAQLLRDQLGSVETGSVETVEQS